MTTGQETKYYHFGLPETGQIRVCLRDESGVYYIATDHLGTTSLVLDQNGNELAGSRHFPYGVERWISGTLPTDYRFAGQREETGLGLYHMGARFYDHYINQFVSADSIIPQPGNPQSLNRFSYALGNPLKFVDPTGHMEEGECGPADNCNGSDDAVYTLYQELGLEGTVDYATFSAFIQALVEGSVLPSADQVGPGENPWPVDAIGWRIDLSAMPLMFGGDANVDALYNLNSGEFDVFLGLSAQAIGEGISGSTGPLFVFGLVENAGYEGGGVYVGGTAVAEIGVEADLCISLSEYQGERPIAGYIGLGFGAEASAYAGAGAAFRITDIVVQTFRPWLGSFRKEGW